MEIKCPHCKTDIELPDVPVEYVRLTCNNCGGLYVVSFKDGRPQVTMAHVVIDAETTVKLLRKQADPRRQKPL